MDLTTKERIDGMILEALGENEKLINHALSLYQQTNLEIDLINLINLLMKKIRIGRMLNIIATIG